ncbi:EP300-interacting inhibitor of differentiation 3-like isoform X1 [Colletes gigas]|uniref:EP300-interacting inhibitor of differentiation 3-like isoform X1 n=3 Tax=Colletes gigas TaxID=935657 RepID=UPI001C9ADB01|nr:EP300-interacting inhibitor of differentiation 3-like isoform X1 [Colletes gigas]
MKQIKMSNSSSNSSDRPSLLRSPQERKETLRKMITRAESLQETVSDNTIGTLESCMEETDNINSETSLEEKIHNQEEVLLDSEMMSISSKILKQCTRTLTRNVCSYNHIDFAQKVVQYVKLLPDCEPELPDWSLLKTQTAKCFKTTPQYSSLLGTLAPLEKKEINKRKSVVSEIPAQIKRPRNVDTVDKEDQGLEQTVKVKEFITQYCRTHHKPLDFFQLILHPTHFGKTIENILQISFLVRDGKVKVIKDDSGTLVVQSCTKDTRARTILNIQNVLDLTMDQWKMLKNIYQLEKPMIDFVNEI